MNTPAITAYLKTTCSWSDGVRAVLAKYNLLFEEKDIIKHPEFREEMERLSNQTLSPCVVINGNMLPDVSGKEVEDWLIANDLIEYSNTPTMVPIDSNCSNGN